MQARELQRDVEAAKLEAGQKLQQAQRREKDAEQRAASARLDALAELQQQGSSFLHDDAVGSGAIDGLETALTDLERVRRNADSRLLAAEKRAAEKIIEAERRAAQSWEESQRMTTQLQKQVRFSTEI